MTIQQPQIDVSDFVSVSVNMSPLLTPYENFGIPMVAGDSTVISMAERFRPYSGLTAVGNDFGTTAPEYLAAEIFFEQEPQPEMVMIGRWASTNAKGQLLGAILTPSQQALTNFTAVTAGSFTMTFDGGSAHNFTGINLSGALNINGVASLVQTAIAAVITGATVVWDATNMRFVVTSSTSGALSSVSFASTYGTGTDISGLLGLQSASGGFLSPGAASETPLAAVTAFANASTAWYGLAFASTVQPATADYVAVANYILASSRDRIFGVNILTTDCLTAAITNDLASTLAALDDKRVFWQYSSQVAYPVMSVFGRAFTVDFDGSDTTIMLAYKQEPGVPGEYLNEAQFESVVNKMGNVNIHVNNGAVMIWPGQMCDGSFFDEVHNTDWFANRVQTDLFNLLYGTTTKVPQDDAGNNLMGITVEGSCAAAINNGMGAPGQWNAPGFGSLTEGMALTAGFYVYVPLIATQSETDRVARKSVTIQVALKLAGAVQKPYVILNINR